MDLSFVRTEVRRLNPHSQNPSDMGIPCNPNPNLNQMAKVIWEKDAPITHTVKGNCFLHVFPSLSSSLPSYPAKKPQGRI